MVVTTAVEGGPMRGDEARVVDAFCRYLQDDGWNVKREVQFVDVLATKGTRTLYAEAKGRTAAIGLDVDTLYGQLLRRVPEEASTSLLGVVVPEQAVAAALRVPEWIRSRLRVSIWAVSDNGRVRLVSSPRG
jgi:hypothetical protein